MSVIIDRRLNDRNKHAANRARFMRRYKESHSFVMSRVVIVK